MADFINSYNSSNIENYCYLSEKHIEDWYFAPRRISSNTENEAGYNFFSEVTLLYGRNFPWGAEERTIHALSIFGKELYMYRNYGNELVGLSENQLFEC